MCLIGVEIRVRGFAEQGDGNGGGTHLKNNAVGHGADSLAHLW